MKVREDEKFPPWRNEEDFVITDLQTALYHRSGGKRSKYQTKEEK